MVCVLLSQTIHAESMDDPNKGLRSLSMEYTNKSEYSDIYSNENGEYAIRMKDEKGFVYVPVGMLEVDLSDTDSVCQALTNRELSSEARRDIQENYERFCNNAEGCADRLIIFSQDLIMAAENPQYYVFQGYEMKSERVYSYNMFTGYQYTVSGVNASVAASDFAQILLFAAGTYSTAISFGATLLAIFESHKGPVAEVTGNDFIQVGIDYNQIKQYTYVKMDGEWVLTYTNYKHNIYNVRIIEFFVVETNIGNVGQTYTSEREQNRVLMPPEFNTPWGAAYLGISYPNIHYNQYKCRNLTYRFQ